MLLSHVIVPYYYLMLLSHITIPYYPLLSHIKPIWYLQDYFKNGIWQNDLMRLDIEVIDAHRREA